MKQAALDPILKTRNWYKVNPANFITSVPTFPDLDSWPRDVAALTALDAMGLRFSSVSHPIIDKWKYLSRCQYQSAGKDVICICVQGPINDYYKRLQALSTSQLALAKTWAGALESTLGDIQLAPTDYKPPPYRDSNGQVRISILGLSGFIISSCI